MPKINVAYRQKKGEGGKKKPPKRMASGSFTTIKNMMKKYPGSEWLVAKYNFKPSVENICIIIQNIGKMDAEETLEFTVSDAGRLKQT